MDADYDKEKIVRYQVLQQRVKVLDNRRELILNRLMEVDSTLSSLDELKEQKEKDIFLPLGSGIYSKGILKNANEMIVLIGADIALDMNFEKANKVLEDNKKILNDGMKTIEEEMAKATEELIYLEPEIQEILQRNR